MKLTFFLFVLDNEIGAMKRNGQRMRTRASRGDQPPPDDELGVTTPMTSCWWSQFVTDEDMVKIEHSGKLILLMDILRQCELIGDKVLVFSQSLVSLNLIEEFLAAEDQRNEQNRASLVNEVNYCCVNCLLKLSLLPLNPFFCHLVKSRSNRSDWYMAFELRLLPIRRTNLSRAAQNLV